MLDLVEPGKSLDSVTFSFWEPVAKSRSAEDIARRIVQGLTSTATWDQQQERMLQEGINFTPLQKSGYINWNHERGPENLIGEPMETGLRETHKGFGLFLRGFLYKSIARADHAWNLLEEQERAREDGYGGRQLGWSVEGGIGARDLSNPRVIAKSVVRHMAMTHEPVNADSYAEIAKSNARLPQLWLGEDVEFNPDRNRHVAFGSFESFAKAIASGPGVGGAGAMGDASPTMNRSWMGALIDATSCKGPCRKRGYRARHKSLAHLTECCGAGEDEAFLFVKSLVLALD